MAQALWPAVGGHYLDALLAAPLGGDDRAWLRDWSSRFARGAAPLPALLVGRDPYGVLPVTQVVAPDYEPAGRIQQVQDILETLSGHWRDSVAAVPRLDPDATDAPQDGEADRVAVAAQVLGAVPRGTSVRLAHVDAMRATYASQLGGRLFVIGLLALTWPDTRGVAYGDDPANRLYAQFVQFSADFDGARTIDEQVAFAGRFADVLDVFVVSDDFTPAQQAVARQIRDGELPGAGDGLPGGPPGTYVPARLASAEGARDHAHDRRRGRPTGLLRAAADRCLPSRRRWWPPTAARRS